jgi:acylphosphatase
MSDTNSEHQRAHVLISGDVQGVFFRDSARQQAARLGLAGWARNLPDGRVEAVFEGPADSVRQAVEWCGAGPDNARVEDVSKQDEDAEGLAGFEVR